MSSEQQAILAGVYRSRSPHFMHSMEELEGLAAACQVSVRSIVTQQMDRPNPRLYVGSGKVKEIKDLMESSGGNVLICNDELSPSQIRNLEETLECKVIDRTMLILDIFSERAATREAQLQVEIAAMQYMLPRLVGLRKSLGRQVGGVGTKNRGVGEKKLELDRRIIQQRITMLRKELQELTISRKNQRKQRVREDMSTVALVGYTNAGKSSLLNAFLKRSVEGKNEKQVLEKDMLFATLETAVRKIHLPDNRSFLLTDTVGFVSQLPHHLIQAFRSTLEEVKEADLLIHVVDASNPEWEEQIRVADETLEEIGVEGIPVIYAFNKIDKQANEDIHPSSNGDSVWVSAKTGSGIPALIDKIVEHLFSDEVHCRMLVPYNRGNVVAFFQEHGIIHSMEHLPEGVQIRLTCRKRDANKYDEFIM